MVKILYEISAGCFDGGWDLSPIEGYLLERDLIPPPDVSKIQNCMGFLVQLYLQKDKENTAVAGLSTIRRMALQNVES